ncbi:hypothetical protein RvY_03326-3 [Ramazzottius varieornatus]|uniref:Peptidase M24 domain-containing protein n=1 Tax=Ramazzottius varieornatus TaxID=947166 RepID=A0A1D1URE8_RAMVA|nr:hypothetical protein RvY_03326-3 [Ramazzottius varieornatus]
MAISSMSMCGYHGDCSETFAVGRTDEEAVRLMDVTKTALYEAIKLCRDGRKLADIGQTIEGIAYEAGYSVIPIFCGHGIGEDFHMKPDIIHIGNVGTAVMKAGMIFTIEPVISEGGDEVEIQEDGWTALSLENSRSAQFEETILITKEGSEILTAL